MNSRWRATYPATMYLLLTLLVVMLSWILELYGVETEIPATGEIVKVQSILSPEGIRWFVRHTVDNFISFAPLGTVVVLMFGLGLAVHSGLIEACICYAGLQRKHGSYILIAVILLGLMSNAIGDAGYVVLLPLSAVLFGYVGLNPMFGVIVAHVATTCGYSANIIVSTMDTVLSRTTGEAMAALSVKAPSVGPLSNYSFMAVSMFMIAAVIYAISKTHLSHQLDVNFDNTKPHMLKQLSHKEKRALIISLAVCLIYVTIVLLSTFSSFGILRGASGGLQHSPFIIGIIFIISLCFGIASIVYGIISGHYRNDKNVIDGLMHYLRVIGDYMVIVFFAAQMFAIITYSNIDKVAIAQSAYVFTSMNVHATSLSLIALSLYTALINMFVASASSKWSIVAYILLPTFSSVGISPEYTQCAFRIGDSITNAITPMMSYAPFVLAMMLLYDKNSTYLTLIKYVWRFTLFTAICWIILFFLWYLLGLSTGM